MTSEAEVCSAPMMAIIAIHCTMESLHTTPIDPLDVPESISLQIGMNNTSAA